MTAADEAYAKHLLTAVTARQATAPCSRCGHEAFDLVGLSTIPLPAVFMQIPVLVVACVHCGAVIFHATQRLCGDKTNGGTAS